uniref:Uncharacterized protein n=1 Tax=Anopheles coluzzii TaxID=1518534 RepID=A0A8W7PLV1_ANOCL
MTFSRQCGERVHASGADAVAAASHGGPSGQGATRCSKGQLITSRTMSSGARRRSVTTTTTTAGRSCRSWVALTLYALLAVSRFAGASYSDTDDLINELDRPNTYGFAPGLTRQALRKTIKMINHALLRWLSGAPNAFERAFLHPNAQWHRPVAHRTRAPGQSIDFAPKANAREVPLLIYHLKSRVRTKRRCRFRRPERASPWRIEQPHQSQVRL